MANQFVQQGERINYTPSADVAAGKLVLFTDRVFFVPNAIAANATDAVQTCGVVQYEKTTGEAWTMGQKLYWNDTTKKLTTTASTNKVAGYAVAAAASADTEGVCLLGQ
jgi:predicted RecA/RadA family phage recombinase